MCEVRRLLPGGQCRSAVLTFGIAGAGEAVFSLETIAIVSGPGPGGTSLVGSAEGPVLFFSICPPEAVSPDNV